MLLYTCTSVPYLCDEQIGSNFFFASSVRKTHWSLSHIFNCPMTHNYYCVRFYCNSMRLAYVRVRRTSAWMEECKSGNSWVSKLFSIFQADIVGEYILYFMNWTQNNIIFIFNRVEYLHIVWVSDENVNQTWLCSASVWISGVLRRCYQCRSRGELGSCKDPFKYNVTQIENEHGITAVPCASGWCGKLIESEGTSRDDGN